MSSKRREKAYRKIALKAQRSFSFGKGLSLCVILNNKQCEYSSLSRIVNSVRKQTYTSFSLFFLTEVPVKKRVLRLLKKFESFTICNKAQLSSELRKGYDVIIAKSPGGTYYNVINRSALVISSNIGKAIVIHDKDKGRGVRVTFDD